MKISICFKVLIGREKVDKSLTTNNVSNASLVKCVKTASDRATQRCSFKTATNYKTALRSVLRYLKVDDVSLGSITADTLEGWQKWMLGNSISLNTVSCYMRSIRSVINRSNDDKTTIFKKVFTGSTRTMKRSLDSNDMSRILALNLCVGGRLFKARDLFFFSFYCQGMPFVDIAFMRKEQVQDGYIHYARHKTGQRVRVAINSPIREILSRYMMKDAPYVFPIITSTDRYEAHNQYRVQLGCYNKALHQLGQKANIEIPLSSYVARHSWASIAFQNNVDLSVISQAMGHTNTKTTMIYIRELDSARLDEANSIVINSLHEKATLK